MEGGPIQPLCASPGLGQTDVSHSGTDGGKIDEGAR